MTAICPEVSPGMFRRGARPSAGTRLYATLGAWRQRARERAQLAQLDDRMLTDIGINRAEAEFLINKPFWRA